MSAHEQFADDLALLAFGSLEGEERVALEKHLEGCAACRRELEGLRGDAALLSPSASGSKPPQRSRERQLEEIAEEPRTQRVAAKRSSSWTIMPWLVAVAMTLVAGFFWRQSDRLSQDFFAQRSESSQQLLELEHTRDIVATLTSTDAMRVTLVAAQAPPQPQGRAIYVRDHSSLIFLASNLPSLPPQKAYELWLIPVNGAPIPAGVFKPDARGSASVIEPPLPGGVEAKAFAITVEPEQGSATPTMPIVMSGAGE